MGIGHPGTERIGREGRGAMYDLVIIGAGPAGATLARAMDLKRKVLLIDKKEGPAERDFTSGLAPSGHGFGAGLNGDQQNMG